MDYDVVIVGAGPAGTSAAYSLRGKGLNVIVIDRLGESQYMRYHRICGAGVNRKTVSRLDIQEDEILNHIRTLRITWPQGNSIDMKIDGCIIDRPRMFLRMRSQCIADGINFAMGTVRHIIMDDGMNSVVLGNGAVLRARYVIGADGAYSIVRKTVFGTVPEIMMPIEEYHSEAETEDGVMQFIVAERYGGGYQWYFPYGKGRCTGAMKGYAEDEPGGKRGIRTVPLGWVEHIVKGNVLLVGDAAGMPNPMTAGGLRTAFESGMKAAESIVRNDPAKYEKWWKKSKTADRRFMKAHLVFSSMNDEELSKFSKYMVHKGVWLNGFHSVIHNPRLTWLYLGCLQALRHGW